MLAFQPAYKLHHDNLVVTAEVEQLGAVDCYTTSLRTMKAKGLLRQRRRGAEGSRAERRTAGRFARAAQLRGRVCARPASPSVDGLSSSLPLGYGTPQKPIASCGSPFGSTSGSNNCTHC